ncbi:MAG TPA: hypothetical protein VFU43_15880 [Streptosporangiaceae bacterium]|nr:hypothetical protein [Streptosporangiaceae bacterium]
MMLPIRTPAVIRMPPVIVWLATPVMTTVLVSPGAIGMPATPQMTSGFEDHPQKPETPVRPSVRTERLVDQVAVIDALGTLSGPSFRIVI